jgi:hypothetical protein
MPLENWRCKMSASWKRSAVGSLAALAIAVSTASMTNSASAQAYHPPYVAPQHGGVAHGGGGNGHGGGGNWHGGGGGNHWHGGGGGGWGPAAVGLGVLGLAAGAAIAAQPNCQAYQPVYDGYGNYMGQQLVNVC